MLRGQRGICMRLCVSVIFDVWSPSGLLYEVSHAELTRRSSSSAEHQSAACTANRWTSRLQDTSVPRDNCSEQN
ncbi:hypothetical protein Q8A73_018125 [Channa argus]|nr:hypothetical protein Q8A73_018125 [Channa argus]